MKVAAKSLTSHRFIADISLIHHDALGRLIMMSFGAQLELTIVFAVQVFLDFSLTSKLCAVCPLLNKVAFLRVKL